MKNNWSQKMVGMPIDKREALEKLFVARGREFNVYPVTPLQQQMWAVQQIDPTSTAYNVSTAFQVAADIRLGWLWQSLQLLTARHEALRTVFVGPLAHAFQVVLPQGTALASEIDLSLLAEDARECEMQHIFAHLTKTPFDTSEGPLFRLFMLRLSPQSVVILFVVHHIICDGWSLRMLSQELFMAYQSVATGQPQAFAQLPPPQAQFADFAVHWHKQLESGALDPQMTYWAQQFAEGWPVLDLPKTEPTANPPAHCGRSTYRFIENADFQPLQRLARQENASSYMALLGVLYVLLHKYAGQADLADVLVGSPVANRSLSEVQSTLGCFINMLALRQRVNPAQSFRQLLRQVRDTVLAAYQNQDVAFESWSKTLTVADGAHPRFQVAFVFQENALARNEVWDALVKPMPLPSSIAKFELTVEATEATSGLHVRLEHDADLFDDALAQNMSRHLAQLVASVVAQPDAPLRDITPLSTCDVDWATEAVNQTESVYPNMMGLAALLTQAAQAQPDGIALMNDDHALTYAELLTSSTKVAAHLSAQGVRPGDFVGIFAESSVNFVLATLGIIHAGAAYVPIDPSYPDERVNAILEDSHVRLLITQPHTAARATLEATPTLDLDGFIRTARASHEALSVSTLPQAAAYVMYTSGSTGKPKGIVVPQQAIARLVCNTNYVALQPHHRIGQVSNVSFDAATFEIWGAFLHGAQLCLVDRQVLLAPKPFADHIRQHDLTTLFLTSALFSQIVQWEPNAFGTVTHLLFGGDATGPTAIRQVIAHGKPEHLMNVYGPTEVTTFALFQEMPLKTPGERRATAGAETITSKTATTIGLPISNTTAYVLDAALQPVPVGVIGEIYLGGDGLAWGYLNRPQLTAEKFMPCPFGVAPGARMYRTGDLAQRDADGRIIFLGREDRQVKIRGFRIELSEIETALLGHEQVQTCYIAVRKNEAGLKKIVAYYVPIPNIALAPQQLRHHLAQQLPEYMLPAFYIPVPAIKLTPNGKVDIRILPEPKPALHTARSEQTPEASATALLADPVIRALAEVWMSVLGSAPENVQQHFVESGGDSIMAIQFSARAKAQGLHIGPAHVLTHPTLSEMADYLAQNTTSVARTHAPFIEGPVPLAPMHRWFFGQQFTAQHHFNQAIHVQLKRPITAMQLQSALNQLTAMHDALRLRFTQDEAGWHAHVSAPTTLPEHPDVPVLVVDLAELPEPHQAHAQADVMAQLQASLNLTHGPLARCALFEAGPHSPQHLFWVAHHICVDSVSWRIVLEDLEHMLAGDGDDSVERLAQSATTPFARWVQAVSQLEGKSDGDLTDLDRQHWETELSKPNAPLRVDVADVPNTRATTHHLETALTADATDALLQVTRRRTGLQMNDVLLTALSRALWRWNGTSNVLVDLEGHGRDWPVADCDVTHTVGWFTALYPLHVDLSHHSAQDDLREMHAALTRVPNRGQTYNLVRHLLDGADANPARISFNYHGQFDQALSQSELFVMGEQALSHLQAPNQNRQHCLEIVAWIVSGQLHVSVHYSHAMYAPQTIEALAQAYLDEVETLARLAATGDGEATALPAVRYVPVSFNQERLLHPRWQTCHPSVINASLTIRLTGELDVATLRQSVESLVENHEIFRTRFVVAEPGVWMQAIFADARFDLPIIDLGALSPHAQQQESRRLYEAEEAIRFELAHENLFRVRLLRLSHSEHLLMLVLHHALMDEWSSRLMIAELLSAYYGAHKPAPQQGLPAQHYASFAQWQRDWVQTPQAAATRQRWQSRLEGSYPLVRLAAQPGIHEGGQADCEPADASLAVPAGVLAHRLSPELTAALLQLGKRERTTLYGVLLAGMVLMLHWRTGRDDVVISTPMANREQDQFSKVMGYFANLALLRTRPTPTLRHRELVQQVNRAVLESLADQAYPIECVAQDMQDAWGMDVTQLFQTVRFSFLGSGGLTSEDTKQLTAQPLKVEVLHFPMHYTLSDLSIYAWQEEGEKGEEGAVCLNLFYPTHKFGTEDAQRMAEDMTLALHVLAHEPDRLIGYRAATCVPSEHLPADDLQAMQHAVQLDPS